MVADNQSAAPARPRGSMGAPVPFDVLEDPTAAAKAYRRHIEQTRLSFQTICSYGGSVDRFAAWLAEQANHRPIETFTDPFSRDLATRDYRSYLLTDSPDRWPNRRRDPVPPRLVLHMAGDRMNIGQTSGGGPGRTACALRWGADVAVLPLTS